MRRINFPSLPDLWTNLRLMDISEVVMGQSPPGETYNKNRIGLPFFQGKAEFGELYPTPQKWCSAPTRIAEAGDILISVRAPVGATNIAKEQCCIGRGLAAIRPNADFAECDFLLFYLRAIEGFLSTSGYGSTFQAINKDELLNLSVPLPTLPEQERIVDILKHSDGLLGWKNRTIEQAKKIPQLLFHEFFGEKSVNKIQWKKLLLAEVISINSQLVIPDNINDANKICIGPDSVESKTGQLISRPTVSDVLPKSGKYKFEKGVVLYSKIRPNLAKVHYATFSGYCSADMYPLSCKESIDPLYLQELLLTDDFTRYSISQSIRGRIPKINMEQLFNYGVVLPPLEKQQQFNKMLTYLNSIIEKLKATEGLLNSQNKILTERFITGELTSAWRYANQTELKKAAKERDAALGISKNKVTISVYTPEERPWLSQPNRHWLMNQLSDFQGSVYHALREWKGTLIPSEDLEVFREQAFPVEHLEDANDQILRALHQLAGLGLIAKISLYNHEGDYVTAFRGLRLEEFSQVSDKQYLAKG